ncbi:MAG TPA: mannosyltransferase family protein [Polyangia bacterium]|nr:mannosyltransferase family protein [Polyangia bacterium]
MLERARYPLTLWLASHAAIVAIAGLSIFLWPYLYTPHGSVAAPIGWIDGLCAWDCRAYAQIAEHGYAQTMATNFWPLLPWLARPLVWLHVPSLVAVVLVANAASLVAFVAIYRVFELTDGEEVARAGLLMFAVYPFSFFFATGYTEPLMIAGSAVGMWLALRGRHVWAAVAFGGGVLARAPSAIGWLGLASAQHEARTRWRTRAALLIPVAVGLLWPLHNWIRFGNPLAWMQARKLWGWHGHINVIHGMVRWREARMLLVYPFFALLPGAGVVALAREKRWRPLAAIAVPMFIIFCVMGAYGLGRYTASVWPAFLPLGVWLTRRPSWKLPLVVVLAMFQGLFLHLFAHAYELQ